MSSDQVCPIMAGGVHNCYGTECALWSSEGRGCAFVVLATATIALAKPKQEVSSVFAPHTHLWADAIRADYKLAGVPGASGLFKAEVFFDIIRVALKEQTERLKEHYRVERGIEVSVPQPYVDARDFSVSYDVYFWTGERVQQRRGGALVFTAGATNLDVTIQIISAIKAMVDGLIRAAQQEGADDHNSG